MGIRCGLSGEAKNVFKPFDDGELQPDGPIQKPRLTTAEEACGLCKTQALSWRISPLAQQESKMSPAVEQTDFPRYRI